MVAGLCAGVLAGCQPPESGDAAADQQPMPATEAPLLTAAARVALPPPMAAADLPDSESRGAQLTAQYCAACHGIPAPSSHSATDWPVVLRRMWLRTEKLDTAFHVPVPDNAQRIVISEYLLANALQVTAGALPDFPGRDRYVATCGRCHGLPDIRQHSPQDWVAVVRRMNGRMETMLNEALTGDEIQRIIGYLERASAGS
jgi:cytochrome c5